MKSGEYTVLAPPGSDISEDEFSYQPVRLPLSRWSKSVFAVLTIALFTSVAANAVLIRQQYPRPDGNCDNVPSKYAQLHRNVPTEIGVHSDHTSVNRTLQDAAWNSFNQWDGFIALDEEFVVQHNLPHSQRWPWDQSKGVYILTATHEVHCVHLLRHTINQYHDGVPEAEHTWPYEHVLHCLNVLRETVMCNADDTPLYAGRVHKNALFKKPKPGLGTIKMCRDWSKLVAWSQAHPSCYRPDLAGAVEEVERYKFCPDGSRPWEKP